VLDKWCRENGMDGFQHQLQSVRVVEKLENHGQGLNLTAEVIEGILKHTKGQDDYSLSFDKDDTIHWEGRVVKVSDRIAYVNHDLQDAIAARLVKEEELPAEFVEIFGPTNRERIASMVIDIIATSMDEKRLALSSTMETAINLMKDWLFDNVYNRSEIRKHDDSIRRCLNGLLDTMLSERDVYEKYLKEWVEDESERKRRLVDYIAGMTDRYAIWVADELMIPAPWPVRRV
jgi:dGTPase